MLTNPAVTASVSSALTTVTADLRSASLTTPTGTVIPTIAQRRTLALLSGDAIENDPATVAALSTAGPEAAALVPYVMDAFADLKEDPASLPTAGEEYNNFTKAASREFIANPPAEFLALNTVLARLVSAAGTQK